MDDIIDADLVNYSRGVLALVLGGLLTLFNYGDGVVTAMDGVLWFAYVTAVGYVILTVFAIVSARIWD
ncbi:hypothetical protein C488_06660 [Natrinema pellirubrum DSM 15624]|uniref:Uncharacterized protein n=1 Tax=Natrinema pellirubrum (strain DSM 15624 / CIP 106293 / JCM 10476 / NCIMB 786 / 157) TaxID=797303 RepID=L0JM16_NATP1|nr:hypothetical protein [Natrinema pellirubrum]AGB31873.1 hypothetical protein Natpe_2044 [Natrinema pellirubrum DSM 15624]ELY77780.1 hypothetical protein C488_06660 [Natrinema pellirubrum DSM 15624]